MRIDRITATPLTIPTRNEIHWAGGVYRGLTTILVRVEADGLVGYGEADGRTIAHTEAVTAGIEAAGAYLVGADALDVAEARRRFYRDLRWHFHEDYGNYLFAGIEMALWDIIGQHAGLPLYRLLGGRRVPVDLFHYVMRRPTDELAEEVRAARDAGFTCFYVKVGYGRAEDDRLVRTIREAAGDEARIRIDAVDAWTATEAIAEIRRLERFDLDWVEQPVPHRDLDGLARVRRGTGVRVAAHQSVTSVADVLEIARRGCADVVVSDAQHLGGLAALRSAGEICAAAGIGFCKSSLESGLGTTASLHVVSGFETLTDGNQVYVPQLVRDVADLAGVRVAPATLLAPEAPGIGVPLDAAAVADAAAHHAGHGPAIPVAHLR